MYIDPDTCIDCGACIPECPYDAIFPEDEVPAEYLAKGGERLSAPRDPNFRTRAVEPYEGEDYQGRRVVLGQTVTLRSGESVNLREDIQPNYDFFKNGPGYASLQD